MVEEYNISRKKGVITRLIIDKNSVQVKSKRVVLELPTHLSFPAIFRIGEEIYIHPENSQAGSHDLYKYNKQADIFEWERNICEKTITDASFLCIDEKHYMFGTKEPDSYGKTLCIYDEQGGIYKEQSRICFKEYIARMGGNFFNYNGKWIRPAQICNNSYGEGVLLQNIEKQEDKFILTDIRRIYPSDNIYPCGLHTFNVYKNAIVVDGKTYKWKFVRRLIDKVRVPLIRRK